MNTTIKTLSAKQNLSKEDKAKLKLYMKIDKILNPKYYLLLLCPLCFSCQSEEIEEIEVPTFEVVSFSKVDNKCTAIIEIKGLHDKFSIDGVIKADEVNSIEIKAPMSEHITYTLIENVINIYGDYANKITINLEWTCNENHTNYLVGWHLSYGFTTDCNILMVDLTK